MIVFRKKWMAGTELGPTAERAFIHPVGRIKPAASDTRRRLIKSGCVKGRRQIKRNHLDQMVATKF